MPFFVGAGFNLNLISRTRSVSLPIVGLEFGTSAERITQFGITPSPLDSRSKSHFERVVAVPKALDCLRDPGRPSERGRHNHVGVGIGVSRRRQHDVIDRPLGYGR